MDPLRYLPERGDAAWTADGEGRRQVALAILRNPDGALLLQHRDDVEGVHDRGKWSLFGGGIDPGEDAETGLRRELVEEIGYAPREATWFVTLQGIEAEIHVFVAEIERPLAELCLGEGQGFAFVSADVALERNDLASLARAAIEMWQSHQRFRERERGSRAH